jgi:hypothetical protein
MARLHFYVKNRGFFSRNRQQRGPQRSGGVARGMFLLGKNLDGWPKGVYLEVFIAQKPKYYV